jgi:hypothetical protein
MTDKSSSRIRVELLKINEVNTPEFEGLVFIKKMQCNI